MNRKELEEELNNGEQFKEIWLDGPKGQSICAWINGKIGWLMYQRYEGDAGFSSRNYRELSDQIVEFYLSNGQRDVYPKNWTYPIEIIKEALLSFLNNGKLPSQVEWHDETQ